MNNTTFNYLLLRAFAIALITVGNLSIAKTQTILEPDHIIVGSNGTSANLISELDTVFYFGKIRGAFRFGKYNLRSGKGPYDAGPGSLGLFSGAWGYGNTAEGNYSTAFGNLNEANFEYSVAWGSQNKSLATGATTWGIQNDSEGLYNTTGGYYNNSKGFATTTFGMFADPIAEVNVLNFINEFNPLFIIGNGSGVDDRSNAFVVLRNNYVGIGTSNPLADLDIQGDTPGIRLGKAKIEEAYNSKALWIHGNILPATNTNDIGGNTFLDHWDRIVANDFVVYQDNLKSKTNRSQPSGLTSLLQIKPISFSNTNKNGNNRTDNGFDIQTLLHAIPHVVLTHEEYYNPDTELMEIRKMEAPAISYMKLIPILTQAIQDLSAIIDQQNERIVELEKQK